MKNKLYLNSSISLFYQIFAIVIGLILPRLILKQYGSEINGLTTSITQMLSVISFLDLGVGAVVQSALYKPLAMSDNKKINEIYNSARKYFKIIAKVLLVYILILCVYYAFFKSADFSWYFTTSLILSIAISYFAQYYFGICNSLLLNADQKIYIVTLVNLLGMVTNAVMTIALLNVGANIQIVKFASSCVYLLRPILLQIYVKKHYKICVLHNPKKDAIPNKWSGLAQHITVVVTNSVDNIMLTFFGTFSMISIYNVYVLPLNSIKNLVEVTSNSFKSYFGHLLAKEEKSILKNEFDKYETTMHFITSVIMSTTLVTLTPFIIIYTSGVNDTNYNAPIFGLMITLAYTMYILRLIYTNVIFAAGKFRETQKYCIIECAINIIISLVLVMRFGLVGVAIGTLLSSGYRMFSSVYYLKKDILHRPLRFFSRHIIIDIVCFAFVMFITSFIHIKTPNFLAWCFYASSIFLLSVCICALVHFIFYRKHMKNLFGSILSKFDGKKGSS